MRDGLVHYEVCMLDADGKRHKPWWRPCLPNTEYTRPGLAGHRSLAVTCLTCLEFRMWYRLAGYNHLHFSVRRG